MHRRIDLVPSPHVPVVQWIKQQNIYCWLQTTQQIVSNLPAPAMGARFTVFLLASRPCGPAGWLALLLTKAGDVETNPGPTTLNKRFWICDICYKQIHASQSHQPPHPHRVPRQPHRQTKDDHMTTGTTQGHRPSSKSERNLIILLVNINGIKKTHGTRTVYSRHTCRYHHNS